MRAPMREHAAAWLFTLAAAAEADAQRQSAEALAGSFGALQAVVEGAARRATQDTADAQRAWAQVKVRRGAVVTSCVQIARPMVCLRAREGNPH